MMRARTFLAYLALGALAATRAAPVSAQGLCKGDREITGKCFWVRGSIGLSADAGLVVSSSAPHQAFPSYRLSGDHDMPEWMDKFWDKDLQVAVFGNFEICRYPDSPHPNGVETIRWACIETAKNVRALYPPKGGWPSYPPPKRK